MVCNHNYWVIYLILFLIKKLAYFGGKQTWRFAGARVIWKHHLPKNIWSAIELWLLRVPITQLFLLLVSLTLSFTSHSITVASWPHNCSQPWLGYFHIPGNWAHSTGHRMRVYTPPKLTCSLTAIVVSFMVEVNFCVELLMLAILQALFQMSPG